ncbi:MAG: response regulator [Candidatus Gastranaerophilales bacterium]|nr:response regulator [Candidatus Gastranaerophilales bacterium]
MQRILIADDSAFMRNHLRKIIESAGYNVVGEARNGLEAVRLYDELFPDMITLDIIMPELNGVEALKAIKDKYPEAKVIMCSSIAQECYVKDSINLGAIDFIVKPFTSKKITAIINKTFEK